MVVHAFSLPRKVSLAHKIHRGAIFVGEKEMKNFLDTLNSSILSTDNKNQSLMYS